MRFEEESSEKVQFKISIPWDKLTAQGFGVAFVMYCIFLFSFRSCSIEPPIVREIQTVPIELLQFGGPGDMSKKAGGNLSERGAAKKGKSPSDPLENAQNASKSAATIKGPQNPQYSSGQSPQPKQNITNPNPSKNPNNSQSITDNSSTKGNSGKDGKDVGSPNGTQNGTGTGEFGGGPGSGLGYGIDWGGGGNRSVLDKVLPKYPPGITTSAQIKLRFVVNPDGTVRSIVRMQTAEPALVKVAEDALRRWRFNPLREEKDMVGTITFTFKVR